MSLHIRAVVRLVNVRVFPRRPLIHAVSKKPGKKNRNASTASVFRTIPTAGWGILVLVDLSSSIQVNTVVMCGNHGRSC
ncbi:hypothetical protein [Photorhabdus antumapuensis]|uniref:hypothetical protein n=1 Tax=Photorhabdus antumapuensis TaxID=2862867 RepID=UPI001CEDA1D0|nr:hypothetical protein [Photorhabdus antumapuensis]